jgi:glycosyltransferase involved in cell wall biosynthesis
VHDVKDEEEMLPGCLAPLAGVVDEMIVVDTGSSDRTVEIAESFGATVVHFPWTGSFAEARNVSIDAAHGDWIIYLDADEHMEAEDARALRALLARTWREGFYLAETNYTGGEDTGSAITHMALRVWRNRPQYRFEGRIHEQKTQSMPTYLPERWEHTSIRVRHYGYLTQRIQGKEKSRRNIELLEQEARENPSPFNDYNLARSLAI